MGRSKIDASSENLQALGLISHNNTQQSQSGSAVTSKGNSYDAVIFVDGSYDAPSGRYAYGMQIEDREGMHYYKKAFDKDNNSSMRNVAGEIAGAKAAMQYCLDHDYKNVHLMYDYLGIESWCTGAWKAKDERTQSYVKFYKDASEYMNIDFEHVKGHTGNDGNELCDFMAKRALGIKDTKKREAIYGETADSATAYESAGKRLADKIVKEWKDFEKSETSEIEKSLE